MEFDDINNHLLISNRIQYLEPVLTVSVAKKFSKYFRQSLILELFWENSIEYKFIKDSNIKFEKISRLTLLRKFISKLFRNVIKN